jgi:hypothetical protein
MAKYKRKADIIEYDPCSGLHSCRKAKEVIIAELNVHGCRNFGYSNTQGIVKIIEESETGKSEQTRVTFEDGRVFPMQYLNPFKY